eukprot:3371951-Amphidinium_carterae.1
MGHTMTRFGQTYDWAHVPHKNQKNDSLASSQPSCCSRLHVEVCWLLDGYYPGQGHMVVGQGCISANNTMAHKLCMNDAEHWHHGAAGKA